MRVAIVGAGSIGSVFAAKLLQGGHDVVLVARNRRLAELREDGLRLRARYGSDTEHLAVEAIPELTPDVAADVVLVAVQRHQIDPVLPALVANPTPRIVFMFNCGEDDSAWQNQLQGRLLWAFPAALATMKDGVVEYVVFPALLRALENTTVGITEGGDLAAARAVTELFDQVGIPSVLHEDMRSWLFSHMALMLPPMAVAVTRLRAGQPMTVSLRLAMDVSMAMREGFRVTSKSGLRLTPGSVRLLSLVPTPFVALQLWLGARIPLLRAAMEGLPPSQYHEVTAMYRDLKKLSERHGVPTPALDRVCAELGRPS